MASVILFYDSDTVSYPDIFKPFTDIPSVSNTLAFKTLSELATETAVQVIPDIKYVPIARVSLMSINKQITHKEKKTAISSPPAQSPAPTTTSSSTASA